MKGIKLFGWLGLLLGVSSIVSFIGFSDNTSAWNNEYPIQYCEYPDFTAGYVTEIINDPPFHTGIPDFNFADWDSALTCFEESGQTYYVVHVAATETGSAYWNYVEHNTRGYEYTLYFSGGRSHFMFDDTGEFLGRSNSGSAINLPFYNKYSPDEPGFVASNVTDTSIAFDNANGEIPTSLTSSAPSNWKPNIKLHKGSNWEVELSDYNFFNFDNPPFTCGENELAPVIHWEVWSISDVDHRNLIDTLVFGAPAVVTYTAPKVQEDRKYEVVAYYSDCEGVSFTQAETKQFTVKKDGNLKSTDLAAVCIMEEFPYINIPNCLGDINDMFVALTFRTPEVDRIAGGGGGGGGWAGLVEGCRELQVLDDWIMKPDIVVCPQMPSSVRSVITPIVTFALALSVITFVANRQGIRGLG